MHHLQYVNSLRGDVGKRLIGRLCALSPTIRCHYSSCCVNYWSLPEFTIRYDKGIVTVDGRHEQCRRRFDSILFVKPTLNATAQQWIFKVAIEVKVNKDDLISDNKIQYYLGWTDFFFIAVPDKLLKHAIEKASNDSRIGVVSLDTGNIIKMPAWQDVSTGRKCVIMEQAFFEYMNKEIPVTKFMLK